MKSLPYAAGPECYDGPAVVQGALPRAASAVRPGISSARGPKALSMEGRSRHGEA